MVFCDPQGHIFMHLQQKDTIINRIRYSDMLHDKPKTAIQAKNSGRLSEGKILLYDSVCLHTTTEIMKNTSEANQI
jgi:hypothetical protein